MRTLLCLGLGFFIGFKFGKLEGKLQEKASQMRADEDLFNFVKKHIKEDVLAKPPVEDLN